MVIMYIIVKASPSLYIYSFMIPYLHLVHDNENLLTVDMLFVIGNRMDLCAIKE